MNEEQNQNILQLQELKQEKQQKAATYCASPAIFGVNFSPILQQKLNHIGEALARGYMESCPIINIPEIDIHSRLQKLTQPLQIALICHIHQPHPWINPINTPLLIFGEILIPRLFRRQGRLLPQGEPHRRLRLDSHQENSKQTDSNLNRVELKP